MHRLAVWASGMILWVVCSKYWRMLGMFKFPLVNAGIIWGMAFSIRLLIRVTAVSDFFSEMPTVCLWSEPLENICLSDPSANRRIGQGIDKYSFWAYPFLFLLLTFLSFLYRLMWTVCLLIARIFHRTLPLVHLKMYVTPFYTQYRHTNWKLQSAIISGSVAEINSAPVILSPLSLSPLVSPNSLLPADALPRPWCSLKLATFDVWTLMYIEQQACSARTMETVDVVCCIEDIPIHHYCFIIQLTLHLFIPWSEVCAILIFSLLIYRPGCEGWGCSAWMDFSQQPAKRGEN